VRGANKKLKQYVLDDEGYTWTGTDYKRKSRLEPRVINVHVEGGGTMKKTVHEKQVVFYSEKYDKRAKAERAATIAKATDFVANPGKYNRATSYGAAAYVKNLKLDDKTGEVLDVGQALLLDWNKIREEEALDGYYMIVTSEMMESDERIIDMYRGLWKIEESFRVMKTDFDARPVYVSTKDHIEAHFLTCFVSLVIARLLELETGHKHSVGKMMESLRRAECTFLQQNYYLFDYCDETLNEIGEIFGVDFSKRVRALGEIKNIFAAVKIG